jgi:SAM-dependent methyltransferase
MLHNKCLLCKNELKLITGDISDIRFGSKFYHGVAFCPSCDIVQTVPLQGEGELTSLYEEYYNFGGEKGTYYTCIREWFQSSTPYRVWIALDGDISFHLCRGTGRLLDVGCNEGRGLKIYKQNGFKTEGLEINERAAIEARKRGFRVYTELIEDFQPKELYDVVVLSNVLEHSLQPKNMLKHVARILKPGGQVLISCPNFNSWQRSFFGRYWINWHVPFHIVHFSRDTLTGMLQESMFEIQEERQESPSLWVAQSIIARLFAKPGQPTRQLRNPLLVAYLTFLIKVFLFPMLWLGNRVGRGDCLVVVANKN